VAEGVQVTVGGQSAASFGAWFDLWGWLGIFTYVCVCRIPERQGMTVAPPTVHPLRVGRRSQFVLADTFG